VKRVLSVIGVVLVVGSLWVWYEVTTFHCPGGPDGPFETYYDNGQVELKGTFKDGEPCGEWLEEGETVTYDPC